MRRQHLVEDVAARQEGCAAKTDPTTRPLLVQGVRGRGEDDCRHVRLNHDKRQLAPQLAEKTGSHFVTRVGNVVVLFRAKATEVQPVQV